MGKYTGLKQIFDKKRTEFQNMVNDRDSLKKKESKLKKMGDIVRNKKILIQIEKSSSSAISVTLIYSNYKGGSNKPYYDKILAVRSYFKSLEGVFLIIDSINKYDCDIVKKGADSIDEQRFIYRLNVANRILGSPSNELISVLKLFIDNYNKNIRNDSEKKKHESCIQMALNDICIQVINSAVFMINSIFQHEKTEVPDMSEDELNNKKRLIGLIDKYDCKFSEEKLLVRLSDDEISEFSRLINEIIEDKDICNAISINVTEDNYKDVTVDNGFKHMKLSLLTQEEREIVDELREIVLEEDYKSTLKIIEPIVLSRIPKWENSINIEGIITALDVLLEGAHKEATIQLIKTIIEVYREHELKKIRHDKVDELNRIANTFNSILSFIKKSLPNVLNQELISNKNELELSLQEVLDVYLPYAKEVENSIEYDFYYEEELDRAIKRYMDLIKYWKNIMQEYYSDDVDSVNKVMKENTNNLVFLCSDYSLDYDEERRKELINTISNLEIKSSHELKCPGGRKGMTRLRKTTRNGTQIDYVEYLERGRKKIHFVPYRYSSSADYRTALLKFNPSGVVKKHLEERYGLSSQCAIYAPILVIEAVGANHSEYSIFEGLLAKLGATLFEEIALLFADENPDFEKLDSKVDEFLANKHAFLASATKEDEIRK